MLMPSILGENLFDDDWMDSPFDRDFWGRTNNKTTKNLMKTDIREHDAGYEMDIDLPGFKKDEIKVELENGYLTIGTMQRSFYVGDDVTQEDIKAKFENGILRLSIPKKDAKAVETKKTIAIEG